MQTQSETIVTFLQPLEALSFSVLHVLLGHSDGVNFAYLQKRTANVFALLLPLFLLNIK